VAELERTLTPPPRRPKRLLLSVDRAFVPLMVMGGEWTEVKTLALGVIEGPVFDEKRGERVVHTGELSYFSRRSEAADFARQALVIRSSNRRCAVPARKACVPNGLICNSVQASKTNFSI
jgi:hypothetical protein